jgi:hypothetical protein
MFKAFSFSNHLFLLYQRIVVKLYSHIFSFTILVITTYVSKKFTIFISYRYIVEGKYVCIKNYSAKETPSLFVVTRRLLKGNKGTNQLSLTIFQIQIKFNNN